MMNSDERIVVLVDMDCFFCQVEVKLQPDLRGKPLAVVQYNVWGSGGIIAVNYEARDHGVSRHMRPDEAKKKCPELLLATVPGVRGKADTSRYRIAGREVVEVLRKHSKVVERASVDEAYLDITELVNQEMLSSQMSAAKMVECLPNTFVIGYSIVGNNDEAHRREGIEKWANAAYGELGDIQSQKLAVAGTIIERIRADIYETTGYRCSAGISYNKILAKLACGLHKPNRQTILPLAGVPSLFQTLPVKKVRNLGGKFGDVVIESLGCNVMADLLSYSLKDLQTRFDDKTGLWLYNIARGMDNEPVTSRLISKSIGSCKNFPGKRAIVAKETLDHWVTQLSLEMAERLDQDAEENNRKATLLTVSYHYYKDNKTISQSRSCRLSSYKAKTISKGCLDIIIKFAKYPIVFIGMSASKFIDIDKEISTFRSFFTANTNATIATDEVLASPTTSTLDKCNSPSKSEPLEIESEGESNVVADNVSEFFDSGDVRTQSPVRKDGINTASTSVVKPESNQAIKSPMSFLRSQNTKLKPDNFKKSFFMNILNANKNGPQDAALPGNQADAPEGQVKFSVENETVVKIQKLPCTNADQNVPTHQPNLNNEPVSVKLPMQNQDLKGINSDETAHPKHLAVLNLKNNDPESGNTIVLPVNSNDAKETPEQIDDNAIKLQDIFPDLDNLDESIVAVLPSRLRNEANLILQSRKKKDSESKVNTVKSVQQKVNDHKRSRAKSAVQPKVNKIDTFFNNETKLADSSGGEELVEKCPECDKLIPLREYLEHSDFHVARNLSKELNKSVARPTVATPENDKLNGKPSVKRKRNKPETRESEKRSKSIAAFFT
ncbi:DNA polymerase eta [Neodiprion pinetum]|uniref:DNA polymerase eta n=1 Tax=Neodiprion pinetum TaxID=441929 RepID=UPI001EDFCE3F|nr:DNApol-eta [Neodiprion pinetum]